VIRALCLALAGGVALAAYDPILSPLAVTDAIVIGQSRVEAQRARFHQPYRLAVSRAPVDAVEIVTPFRRVVLAAEARARAGATAFTQREALALLAEADSRVEIDVELTFHPLNTYLGVPAYFVTLGEGANVVQPASLERLPLFSPRVDRLSPPPPVAPTPVTPSTSQPGQPLVGGTVITQFDSCALNPSGAYDIVIREGEKEIARARVDLGKLR